MTILSYSIDIIIILQYYSTGNITNPFTRLNGFEYSYTREIFKKNN